LWRALTQNLLWLFKTVNFAIGFAASDVFENRVLVFIGVNFTIGRALGH
jgi:hypothetical protein